MDDVICVSSEDEFESPPPKRVRPSKVDNDVIRKLNKLKEINFKKCEDNKTCSKTTIFEENNITIIIESDEKSKENQNNVVNLIDDSFEDVIVPEPIADPIKSGENNTSNECVIVASDSDTENNTDKQDVVDPSKDLQTREESKEQNGFTYKDDNLLEKTEIKIPISSDDILNRPSTSKATDAHKLLDEFLETCAKSMMGSKYEGRVVPKFPKMKKNFEKCENIHREPNFMRMLQEFTVTAKMSAPEAVVSFQRIYSYLLDNINGTGIEVTSDELLKLKKLEKTCRILTKRLKKLEEAEVDFDDDEDSVYMQIDRYTQRLNKVYNKYCQLLKKSPYSGRLMYERLQFVSSKYNEINRAITKSWKKNHFPSYYDVEQCIRKCVSENNLGLSETEIKDESKTCFTNLGKLLQMRRKKELYEVHCGFITLNEDPANQDENLKTKLQESLHEGDKKMKEVVDKFVKMQEENVKVEVSEDSDDSNYNDSGSGAEETNIEGVSQ